MIYFLDKIFERFGYKIVKINELDDMILSNASALLKQVEKRKERKDKNSKMNANMIAVQNAITRLEARNEKLSIENIAREAHIARNTAKKYRSKLNSPQPERPNTDSDGFEHQKNDAIKLYRNPLQMSKKAENEQLVEKHMKNDF